MRWTILALLAYSSLVLASNSPEDKAYHDYFEKLEGDKDFKGRLVLKDAENREYKYEDIENKILATIPKGMKELPDEEPPKGGRSRQRRDDDSINTEFHFYTRKAEPRNPLLKLPYRGMANDFRASLVNVNGFDKLPVRLIVHGFTGYCDDDWVFEMKDAFLKLDDCIVICVDWRNGATFPNYVAAASNTRDVGRHVAKLLHSLKEQKGLKLSRTHIIGFSLGAQASGFAGKELNKASESVGRITGLDPAGPLFDTDNKTKRLDRNDAEFVDVIHTNGYPWSLLGFGLPRAVGHADFYPNGGRLQPGCRYFGETLVKALDKGPLSVSLVSPARVIFVDIAMALYTLGCHHKRAYKLFTQSISPDCNITSYPCDEPFYSKSLKENCFTCYSDLSPKGFHIQKCGRMGFYSQQSGARGSLYAFDPSKRICTYLFDARLEFEESQIRSLGRLQISVAGYDGVHEFAYLTRPDKDVLVFGGVIPGFFNLPRYRNPPLEITLIGSPHKNGTSEWDIGKVELTDQFGDSYSSCGKKILKANQPLKIKLVAGRCG